MKTIKENSCLELTRHIGEAVYINDNIVVSVERVTDSKEGAVVHLRISAPKKIPIHREEIQESIIRQN
jgi:carbon storage regulator CsrA